MNNLADCPYVTVLMPVFNAERYLRQSIDSILAQTYDRFEFLIINDGSTDDSRRIIDSYDDKRVRLIDNRDNLGLAPTLNRGLELASHELIARQDADDISHKDRLKEQVSYMIRFPDVALLGAQTQIIDENGCKKYIGFVDRPSDNPAILWYSYFDNPFIHSTLMFKKSIVAGEYGGYTDHWYNEDFELWSRISLKKPVHNLQKRLLLSREHEMSFTGSSLTDSKKGERSLQGNINIVKRNIDESIGRDVISYDEIRILKTCYQRPNISLIEPFLAVYGKLLKEFKRTYPGCDKSDDFKQTVAIQHATIAYSILSRSCMKAIALYFKALSLYPRLMFRLPWGRIIALMMFGQYSREYYRRGRDIMRKFLSFI